MKACSQFLRQILPFWAIVKLPVTKFNCVGIFYFLSLCCVNLNILLVAAVAEVNKGTSQNVSVPASSEATPGDNPAVQKVNGSDQTAKAEFFEKKIRPLLDRHCYECHAGEERAGGLLLDSSTAIRQGGDSGAAIIAGDLDKSLVIQAVRYTDPEFSMPPSGKMSASEIADLESWVLDGAYDPRDSEAQLAKNLSSGPGMSIEDGRSFWSLRKIEAPVVPNIDSPWVKTPIDAFVLETLQANHLEPAAIADRKDLIRRLKYDLLGLPPTVEETEDFVNDTRKDAYRRLVDQYLSSEQYGVRWGRHWLDVARYADSNGLDENLAFGNAWQYRDWVVNSFNSDKPYGDFVVEQIAGDLLPDADRSAITATGFLVLGAKVLAEPDREKLEMDTIDEQLDTTGKVFLGMTFGCVRCHDHKFDPITQADYYGLAAIFKSTQTFGDTNTGAIKHWNEHVFATAEDLESMKEVEDRIAALKKSATDFRNRAYGDLRQKVRSQAVDYLVAATSVELDMSLNDVEEIAAAKGLHPRVLHHCRKHLQFHPNDPVFAPWHALSGDKHAEQVEALYRERFRKAVDFDPKAPKKDSEVELADGDDFDVGLYHSALMDNSGFLAVPPKPDFAFDASTYQEYGRLMEEARLYESAAPDVDSVMSVKDGEIVPELAIHIRGNHRNLGPAVKTDVPEVMRFAAGKLPLSDQGSGRLALARWLTSGENPLTARVQVNRIWGWHFGTGLVQTTENFGVLGDRASHPRLLDWLAAEFVENEWSTKKLQRMIVLSSTYQQSSSSQVSSLAQERDPGNRWLWKFPMRRLEAEQLRDAILAVSGKLDVTLGGKTVPLRNRQFVFNHTSVDHTKYDSVRRAIYLPVIRNNLYTAFEQFDFPDPTTPTGHRSVTTVAPQALLLMNSPLVIEASDQLARQLTAKSESESSRIESAFLRILGRKPDATESAAASKLIQQVSDGSSSSSVVAWSVLCQSLLAANEFIYIQ